MREKRAATARAKAPWALIAAGALSLLALELALQRWGARHPPPEPPAAPELEAAGEGGLPVGWRELGRDSPLRGLRQVAFASGAALLTDGEAASLLPAGGAPRPLESPVPIPQVFAAAGRLFAQGLNDGAPLLIALIDGEARVVPVPCRLQSLAGGGDHFAGACEGGQALAVSRDGARSFGLLPITLPAGLAPPGAVASIESVASGASGDLVVVAAQRWVEARRGERLHWTLHHLGVREGGRLRFFPVPGLMRTAGARLSGAGVTLAGLELLPGAAADGVLRPRIWRGSPDKLEPIGVPGPECASGQAAVEDTAPAGVLLGVSEAAFLCEGRVVLTYDAGRSWRVADLGVAVDGLWGGDMTLLARAGERLFERRLALRIEGGAVGVRIAEPGPHDGGPSRVELTGPGLVEPVLDGGGLGEPAPGDGRAAPAPDGGLVEGPAVIEPVVSGP